MTVVAANVVSPVLPASIVVMAFLTSMAGETVVGSGLGIEPFERDYFGFVTCSFHMGAAWAMTRFAALDLVFPALELAKFSVFRTDECIELFFVATPAGLCADIIVCRRANRHLWPGELIGAAGA